MVGLLAAVPALSQSALQPDWRRVGNHVIEAGLASPAGGPVDRAWYSADGAYLYLRLGSGEVYETSDYETWRRTESALPPPPFRLEGVAGVPETGARVQAADGSRLLYALGRSVYRSEDGGAGWRNLTQYRSRSLVGDDLSDLAISPRDPDQLVVAGRFGAFRSMDGGLSWTGLNEGLPNLPVRRLLRLPSGGVPMRVELGGRETPVEAVWASGERDAWTVSEPGITVESQQLRQYAGAAIRAHVAAVRVAGDFVYAGGEQGRLWVSTSLGRSWRAFRIPGAGTVEAIWSRPSNPAVALAVFEASAEGAGVRVARTINGGLFWDDLTENLPPGSAHGVTADLGTGAVYVATDSGLYLTYADLVAAGPATSWTRLEGRLPAGQVRDVRLDEAGNQVWVAVEGHGVFAALAPHRFRDPRVVNAADWSDRAAAPGTLLTVLGSRVAQAQAGSLDLPVLGAADSESQIQVPFEATGSSLRLALMAAAADGSFTRREMALALRATSPAIFLDKDGAPMVLDADRAVLLDAGTPARAGSRIQILATGLGRVTPDWPTGLAAPLDNPPRVTAPVHVFLDRSPVDVTSATLAPGYVGFYVIEVQLPDIVNTGPAELYLEAGGQASGRVTLTLTQ